MLLLQMLLLLLQLQLLLLLHLQAQLDNDRLDWFSTTSAGQLPSFSLLLRNERKKKKPAIPLVGLKILGQKGISCSSSGNNFFPLESQFVQLVAVAR